jgi:hypothetical protein
MVIVSADDSSVERAFQGPELHYSTMLVNSAGDTTR